MVVSVVCREVADDANSWSVPGDAVWLRISRVDGVFAFHASADGSQWEFVRHFAIAATQLGFVVQAPIGTGCAVVFDEVRFAGGKLTDLRDGS